jgi:thiosulfate/3-mercaptopyruvate sulfurtransferase
MEYTSLISTHELASRLEDPEMVIFDCRHDLTNPDFGERQYAESHIVHARFAHVDRDLAAPLTGSNGRHPLPAVETFADYLGRMGVDSTKQVVGYDATGGSYASRLWWMLRWLGHDRVAVLDGGWDAWRKSDYPVTREVPKPAATRFVPHPRSLAVDVGFVREHLGKADLFLLDARSNERFHGKNETIDPVAGHIPGAHNRFFKENLDAQGYFKPAQQLRAEFEKLLGETKLEHVVHHCGSGVSACHNLLAMEIAGMRDSRLYPGSWSEWIADRTRPVET